MTTTELLSNAGACLTLTLGIVAVLSPQSTQEFISIRAFGKEGI